MGFFIAGDVVVLPFPNSDLSGFKKRPAFVLSSLKGRDVVLCQISGSLRKEETTVLINNTDFIKGNLRGKSNIRVHRLFTADEKIIDYKIGKVDAYKITQVKEVIKKILT